MSSYAERVPQRSGGGFGILTNLPLSVKLVIAFILVTTIAEAILAYFNTTTTTQELINTVGSEVRASAENAASNISGLIDQNSVDPLTALSLNKLLQDRLVQVNADYSGTDAEIQTQLLALDQQWVNAPDESPLIQSRVSDALSEELKEFRSRFPANVEVFLTDKYGGLVLTTNRTSDYYQADEAWWQKAWNDGAGAVFVGQPEYDESAQTYSLIVAIPMYAHNPSGSEEIVGILRSTMNFSVLQDFIGGFTLGQTGHTDLLLPTGDVIAHEGGDPAKMNADLLTELQGQASKTYARVADYEGTDSIVSLVPVAAGTSESYVRDLGWSLIIHQDVSEALQPVTSTIRSTVTTGAVVLILVALIAVLVARLITRPIVRLTRISEQFANGNFTERAPVEGRDEIGSLSFAFNIMAEQFQDLVGTLEDRVANSTRDLQTVADVNAQISTVLEEGRLLQDVADLTKERFRLYHAHIYRLDSAGDTLVLAAGAGHVGRQMVAEVRSIALNNAQSIVASAGRNRRGVIINDVTESKTFLPHPLLPDTRSELAVPLVARGQLLGVLDVQSDRVGYFTNDTLAVIELLAGQIAVAISNARLYESAERTSRHERALGNIDRKIQDAVDMDEILQVTVRELGKALRVPYTAIELRLNQPEEQDNQQDNHEGVVSRE